MPIDPIIKSIRFTERGNSWSPGGVNVVIGANNSGKSTFLRELRNALLGNPELDLSPCVVADVEVLLPSSKHELFDAFDIPNRVVKNEFDDYHVLGYAGRDEPFDNTGYPLDPMPYYSFGKNWEENEVDPYYEIFPTDHDERIARKSRILSLIGPLLVSLSCTEDRLLTSIGAQHYGFRADRTNLLSRVYSCDPTLASISPVSKKLFGKDVIIDPLSEGGYLLLKVAENFDSFRESPKELSEANSLVLDASPLRREGDGFRSFIAVCLALLADDSPVLLIDEPESFLHPVQAFELGGLIGRAAKDGNQIFVATHSPHLLSGVLDSSDCEGIRIIRMNHSPSWGVTALDNDAITQLLGDPFLRNTRVFEGLFARFVLVVESESDELVYRLLLNKLGITYVSIINVHSKDRVCSAIGFYRSLHVHCGAIVDFDILNDAGKWKKLVNSFGMQDAAIKGLAQKVKEGLSRHSETSEAKLSLLYKNAPLTYIPDAASDVQSALAECCRAGCLVVETGELETVLEKHVPYKEKRQWIQEAVTFLDGALIEDISDLAIVRHLKELLGHVA